MSTITPIRIPVCNADGVIIERVDQSRARRLAKGSNVELVRKRKGEVVRINLKDTADDSLENSIHSSRAYSHNHENLENPEKVWTLKRLAEQTADLYDTVVHELIAA